MHYSTNTVSPTTHVVFGTDNATAPRSVRYGRRFRGSREGSLPSPALDPRLFHLPLRGRGIDRSAVAESTAPRSRNRPLHRRGIDRSAVADSLTVSRAKPVRQELPIPRADVIKSLPRAFLGGAATPHGELCVATPSPSFRSMSYSSAEPSHASRRRRGRSPESAIGSMLTSVSKVRSIVSVAVMSRSRRK